LSKNKRRTYRRVTGRTARINGATDMTDLNTMTKAQINALLPAPLTASALKKTSHADLVAVFDAMSASDALDADLRDARADDPTPVLDNSSALTPTDADVLNVLKGLTPAEYHLLVAFAHCENTVVNASPKQATGPADLTTWVWLEDRKVGDMTTPQKKGVLSSLVKKGLVHVSPDSDGDMLGWSLLGFEVVQSLLDEELPALSKKAPKPSSRGTEDRISPASPSRSSGRSQPFSNSSNSSLEIVIVLAPLRKHGPNPSYTEDRTLSASGAPG